MSRQNITVPETVVTITPGGGSINRTDGDDGEARGSGHRGGRADTRNRPVAETAPAARSPQQSRPERGDRVPSEESAVARTGGNREAEALIPERYFPQYTLPVLRNLVGQLAATENSGFTSTQEAHYTRVVTALADELAVTGETREQYIGAHEHLEEIGGKELAGEIKDQYRAELTKALMIFEGYTQPISAEQARALLIVAEFMLTEYQRHSTNPEAVQRALATNPLEDVAALTISPDSKRRLGEALNQVRNHIDFSYLTCYSKVVDSDDHYIRPDASDVPPAELRLDPEVVREHLRLANQNAEGAYRLLLNALDRLDPAARIHRLETRTRNPEVALPVEDVFMGWQARVEASLGHTLENKDYVSACLGNEKLEGTGLIKARHENKHIIRNVSHRAPIRKEGRTYERLAEVQAAEITLKARVYKGEWQHAKTLAKGESAPKDYFDDLVELTVWATTLDSANKVEDFYDQLTAAEAVILGTGNEVTRVVGRRDDAKAFRIPVMDHKGEPTFIVVDRATMIELQKVCSTSRRSYAELARTDPRYKADSKEVRWARFAPQLQEHPDTPESWVDQERDMNSVEELAGERINALRAAGGEGDEYTASLIHDALENYTREFNEFQLHYCRPAHYRALAAARLSERGTDSSAHNFQQLLDRETNAIAVEYANRLIAFRTIATRVLGMRPAVGASAAEVAAMQAELDAFLANIDYELRIQTRAASTDLDEGAVRGSFTGVTRPTLPHTPTSVLPIPAFLRQAAEARRDLDSAWGRQPTPVELNRVEAAVNPYLASLPEFHPEADEAYSMESLVHRAYLIGIEHHDPTYHWTDGGHNLGSIDAMDDVCNAVDAVTHMSSRYILNTDPNSSRIACVPAARLSALHDQELPRFPADAEAVTFEVGADRMDSYGRTGVLRGIVILPKADAMQLRMQLRVSPEKFFELVKAVNGGELESYQPGTLMSMRTKEALKGTAVSIYMVDDLIGAVSRTESAPFSALSTEPAEFVATVASDAASAVDADETVAAISPALPEATDAGSAEEVVPPEENEVSTTLIESSEPSETPALGAEPTNPTVSRESSEDQADQAEVPAPISPPPPPPRSSMPVPPISRPGSVRAVGGASVPQPVSQ